MELIFRHLVGGLVVSLFAVIGDVLKPKSLAGLFGAAPSVALATRALAIFPMAEHMPPSKSVP